MEVDNLMMLADAALWVSENDKLITRKQLSDAIASSSGASKRSHNNADSSIKKRKQLFDAIASSPGASTSSHNNAESSIKKRKVTFVIKGERSLETSLRDTVEGRGGDDIRLVMEKRLTSTDLSSGHSRLSMPECSLRAAFLRDGEASKLAGRAGGLEVVMVDQRLREHKLMLKQWSMGKRLILNLNGNWNSVVSQNPLAPNDLVQLWSFRRLSRLCFALVKVKECLDC